MKDVLKMILLPLLIAAIIVVVISGVTTAGLLIKIAWNLMFHTVTEQMFQRLVCSSLLLITSSAITMLCGKMD